MTSFDFRRGLSDPREGKVNMNTQEVLAVLDRAKNGFREIVIVTVDKTRMPGNDVKKLPIFQGTIKASSETEVVLALETNIEVPGSERDSDGDLIIKIPIKHIVRIEILSELQKKIKPKTK